MARVKMTAYDMVQSREFNQATINWFKYPHEDPGKAFMKYLGVTTYNVQEDTVYMPPEAAIYLALKTGKRGTAMRLSSQYGVSDITVRSIGAKTTWSHVTDLLD